MSILQNFSIEREYTPIFDGRGFVGNAHRGAELQVTIILDEAAEQRLFDAVKLNISKRARGAISNLTGSHEILSLTDLLAALEAPQAKKIAELKSALQGAASAFETIEGIGNTYADKVFAAATKED
jgi:hypothetical protein